MVHGGEIQKMIIPLWIKLSYTLMAVVVLGVYWFELGPANYLWFSDIALILMVPALWRESRFLTSMMAVAVLAIELGWMLDMISGGNLFGIAAYMFEGEEAAHVRFLSGLFHVAMPLTMLYMLWKLGYEPRALWAQILLALLLVPLTRLLTGPERNINWVYGPNEPQTALSVPVYLAVQLAVLIFLVYLPSHFLLKRLFPRR